MSDPFVIVGGDAAGLSAASKFKRANADREVIVFEKGEWVSYAHCGMPYYVGGQVDELTDLVTLTPDDVADRGIDLRRHHEVVGVDPESQTVTVDSPDGIIEQPYGDLLIGTGAHAITGPFADGLELDGAFTMHDMNATAAVRAFLLPPAEADPDEIGNGYTDAELIEQFAERSPPETAAIVGGGYVGVEMAEAFAAHDLDVHIFQRPAHLLPPFGEAVAEEVESHLTEQGVTVHTGTEVEKIVGDSGHVEAVEYETDSDEGQTLSTELALVGIGIEPNTDLLAGTDIELGESSAVATDDYGRTNLDHVYAAGDCAEMRHTVTGDPDWVPLGLTANRAGRAIGSTVAGDPTPVGDIAGTAVVKAFELECGRTGVLDHDRARDAGFDPVSETVTAGSRSGYYPGNAETTVTMTADRETGRLLGASIVGADTAAKRIDTVSTALESDLTVAEFERLDLSYAPPFSPVWDPLLVAAKVLHGKLA